MIGVRDFARQKVDLVRLDSGEFGPREVLTEVQNANVGVFDGGAGDSATVVGAGAVRITGVGRNTPGGRRCRTRT